MDDVITIGNNKKRLAKALLYTDIHPTQFSPMIVQHPFTNTGIVGFNKDGETLCLNIAESKEDLAEWQRLMDKKIEEAKDVYRIYIHLNKPYSSTNSQASLRSIMTSIPTLRISIAV